jgi:hypothetical protein
MNPDTVLIVFGVSLLAAFAGYIAWDIWLASDKRKGNTITEVVQSITAKHPWIIFFTGLIIGFLAGHFWF